MADMRWWGGNCRIRRVAPAARSVTSSPADWSRAGCWGGSELHKQQEAQATPDHATPAAPQPERPTCSSAASLAREQTGVARPGAEPAPPAAHAATQRPQAARAPR
uniref:Uncharacterized protein n=1 Tax=Chlamydomonas leiostraca TaxID=1034604 RepID=A0A7S0X0V9_9CHLO|mmetsp:Transcript_8150/g.20354  ORF Transcript_8150/g.20354 Transcript_8150/m.20354 type:complete len:106 (+) Transcript_8150:579-896(+)